MDTIVVALGGNALLRRGEAPELEVQRDRLAEVGGVLAPLACDHHLVLTHGNGPQVGLLALQSDAGIGDVGPYALDALGAETEGLIGYLLQQSLRNAARGTEVVTLLSQVIVAADDPAFDRPTKPIGRVYADEAAARRAGGGRWTVRPDGDGVRRVVPSPEPVRLVELPIVRRLLDLGVVVIAAGGGGIPVVEAADGALHGVEAVIDKDLASAMVAISLGASRLVMVTDVDGVYDGWGTSQARRIRACSPADARALALPGGSMGPKVLAAARVAECGGEAVIGSLDALASLLAGESGTRVSADVTGVVWA